MQHTRSTIAKLTTKLTDTPEQTRTARQALDDARTLGIDTAEGLAGVSTLIGTTQTSLNGFVTSTSEALDQGSSLLSQAAAQANQSVGTVTGTISAANQQVGGLINTAEDINQANADIIDQLKGLPNANREPLQSAIATLESRNSELAGALGNLDSLNTTIGNASTDTAGLAQHLNTATQTTVREANTARGTITSGAIPQLNTGLNALSSTASTLSTGITSQGSLIDQSKHTLDQLDKAASTTVTALRDTDKALAGVQTKLDTLVTDIKALSISSSLSSLIGTDGKLDAATIADFMLSPTVISEQAVYPVASYGSGMAPLFTTLSLWVGAFVLVVIPKLETDDEGIDDLTPTQGYLGRFLLLATLAAVQGLVTAIGDLVIGIQCASAPVFLLTCVITSLVYMSVIFALSTTFMHVGKGVCVALVILQVPGASGLYPIEMMPAFFRAIYRCCRSPIRLTRCVKPSAASTTASGSPISANCWFSWFWPLRLASAPAETGQSQPPVRAGNQGKRHDYRRAGASARQRIPCHSGHCSTGRPRRIPSCHRTSGRQIRLPLSPAAAGCAYCRIRGAGRAHYRVCADHQRENRSHGHMAGMGAHHHGLPDGSWNSCAIPSAAKPSSQPLRRVDPRHAVRA